MDGWTVKQLQDYLREQNGKHSNMNRTELLDLAKLYAKKPVEDPSIAAAYDEHYAELLQKRKMFEKINKVTKTNIFQFDIVLPKTFAFNQIVVNKYLMTRSIEIESEVVDVAIEKPADKGKNAYNSGHIFVVEYCMDETNIFFYANVKASLKMDAASVFFPKVCLDMKSGLILTSECSCQASEAGQCSHTSALLHCLLDLFAKPKRKPLNIRKACTEKVFMSSKKIKFLRLFLSLFFHHVRTQKS